MPSRRWTPSPANLTFSAAEAVAAARAFPHALIVPLHFEGWEHFTESQEDVAGAFAAAGLADRLRWPVAGRRWDPAGSSSQS